MKAARKKVLKPRRKISIKRTPTNCLWPACACVSPEHCNGYSIQTRPVSPATCGAFMADGSSMV